MTTMPSEDLPTLTSLRFFAALMIFVYHIQSWNFAPYPWAKVIAPSMFHGVSLFFVLSGFVLTHAYFGREFSLVSFYWARVARIVPLHIFCMLLLVAALPLPLARNAHLGVSASLASYALKLILLDSWIPTRDFLMSWNSVSWSLSVEMAFYSVFPWLLARMSRRPILTLCGAAAVSAAVFVCSLGLPMEPSDGLHLSSLELFGYFPPARGFEFALGMATYLFWLRFVAPLQLSAASWTVVEAVALGFALIWLCVLAPPLLRSAEGAAFAALRASGSAWMFAPLIAAMAGGARPCRKSAELACFYVARQGEFRVLSVSWRRADCARLLRRPEERFACFGGGARPRLRASRWVRGSCAPPSSRLAASAGRA